MSGEEQVEAIVNRALGPRLSVWSRFVRLARALGWTGLFAGAGVRLAGSLLTAVSVAAVGVAVAPGSAVGTLVVSPLLLLVLTSLVDAADRVGPLAGFRRSTLFTVTEVTAVRIVGFAAGGLLFAVVVGAASGVAGSRPGVALVAEGCAATAVLAVLVLVLLQHGWDRLVLVLPAVWVLAVVLPASLWARELEAVLRAVAPPIWGGVVLVGLVLFGVVDGRALRPGRGVLRAAGL